MPNEHVSYKDDLARTYMRGVLESIEVMLENSVGVLRGSPNFQKTCVRLSDLQEQVKRIKEGCDTEFLETYR